MSNGHAPTLPFDDLFGPIDRFLDFYVELLETMIIEGLGNAAPAVGLSAAETEVYYNVTGATRFSTRAFAHDWTEIPDEARESVADAEELNPGHTDEESIRDVGELEPHHLYLTVMTATDYSYWLNIRKGGQSMFLEAAIFDNIDEIMRSVVDQINNDLPQFVMAINTGNL